MQAIPGFYPVHIRESRYSGTYSGGQWVLMAGCYNPGETDAFGSDIPCMDFWMRVKEEGPVIEIDERINGTSDVYVSSGGDPRNLVEEAREYVTERSVFEYECFDCDVVLKSESRIRSSCEECGGMLFRRSTTYNG